MKFVKLNLERFRAHLNDEKMKKQLIKVRFKLCFVGPLLFGQAVSVVFVIKALLSQQRYWFLQKLLCVLVAGLVHVYNKEDM